ncbi:MAG: protocatechuate 3,4-dioxygenase subunit alpha [Paracoccaceae bacterium]
MQDDRKLRESASQTAGPYVHIGLTPELAGLTGVYPADLGREIFIDKAKGPGIRIEGTVIDGAGDLIKDAVIETWQSDAKGRFDRQSTIGWGRTSTDLNTGLFAIDTIKPGTVSVEGGHTLAPHISVWVIARGINAGLFTRIYFADESVKNAADPTLSQLSDQTRIKTLLAQPQAPGLYRFDIRLQGDEETVFLDI